MPLQVSRRRFRMQLPPHFETLEGRCLLSASPAVGGVLDVAQEPRISIDNVSQDEGQKRNTRFVFTVTLSDPSPLRVTVHYTTAGGSARAATDDFTFKSGTLIFESGQTSQTITVNVQGDRRQEDNEWFFVNLTRANHATFDNGQGVGTILNDEPVVSINSAVQQEGTSGTSLVTLTVTLAKAYDLPVTVECDTADGSATQGSDFTAFSGQITFAPGETSKLFTIAVQGDTVYEADEYFPLYFHSLKYGNLAVNQSNVTILDSQSRLSIDGAALTKGPSGTSPLDFTVHLRAAEGVGVTVDFTTQDGTAYAGADYLAASGTLTFAPGETTKTVTVQVIGDDIAEYDEYFYVSLSNPSPNVVVTSPTGYGTIYDVYGDPNYYYGGDTGGWYDSNSYGW